MAGESFRIVSYNVRYFGHALRGVASTRASKRNIALNLARLDPLPAIVCLQEVETRSLRADMGGRLSEGETQLESFMGALERAFAERGQVCPYEAFYFRAHTYRLMKNLNVYTTGLAVLVDMRRLKVDAHNVEAPAHITHHHILKVKDRKQTRICAHMRLRTAAGTPLHVFNTHLSLPTPFNRNFWATRAKMGYGPNQLHEARTLVAFVRRHAADDPFIVCGDFNAPPGSPVYRLLEDEGLVCAEGACGLVGDDPRSFPTAGFMHLRMHLDHIFSGGVTWCDCSGTKRFGDRSSPFVGLSDHVPLISTFRLDERTARPLPEPAWTETGEEQSASP